MSGDRNLLRRGTQLDIQRSKRHAPSDGKIQIRRLIVAGGVVLAEFFQAIRGSEALPELMRPFGS